jgi:hypothetical protein
VIVSSFASWPADLNWIIKKLERLTHRPFSEMLTEAGPPIRRYEAEVTYYSGDIPMGESTFNRLMSLRDAIDSASPALIKITTPDLGEEMLAMFTVDPERHRRTPDIVKSSQTIEGNVAGPKSLVVRISLAVRSIPKELR